MFRAIRSHWRAVQTACFATWLGALCGQLGWRLQQLATPTLLRMWVLLERSLKWLQLVKQVQTATRAQLSKRPQFVKSTLWLALVFSLVLTLTQTGCQNISWYRPEPQADRTPYSSFVSPGQVPAVSNPLQVGEMDSYILWETVVDVVRLYFDKVANEFPCQRTGDVFSEGYLETYPQTASTVFEPWRRDSVNLQERRLATVQSMRRIARVRVRHNDSCGGFLITVQVNKELEDLENPSYAKLPSATFRMDTNEPEVHDPIAVQAEHAGWIPQGRDTALETEILRQISQRLR